MKYGLFCEAHTSCGHRAYGVGAGGFDARARVLRGGAWNNNPRNLRATNRNWNNPMNTNENVGFRCVVRSPAPPIPPMAGFAGVVVITVAVSVQEGSPCASQPAPRVIRGRIYNSPAATGRRVSVRRPSPGTVAVHLSQLTGKEGQSTNFDWPCYFTK